MMSSEYIAFSGGRFIISSDESSRSFTPTWFTATTRSTPCARSSATAAAASPIIAGMTVVGSASLGFAAQWPFIEAASEVGGMQIDPGHSVSLVQLVGPSGSENFTGTLNG